MSAITEGRVKNGKCPTMKSNVLFITKHSLPKDK